MNQSKKIAIASGLLVSTLVFSTVIPATAKTAGNAVTTDTTKTQPTGDTTENTVVAAAPSRLQVSDSAQAVVINSNHEITVQVMGADGKVMTDYNDKVVLSLTTTPNQGIVYIFDKYDDLVLPDGQVQNRLDYAVTAEGGVATFKISDNKAESVPFKFSLPSATNVTATLYGYFNTVRSYALNRTTIADAGSLKANASSQDVVLTAKDSRGFGLANAVVWLAVSKNAIGSTTASNGQQLTDTAQAFMTDKNGQVMFKYKAASTLPRMGFTDYVYVRTTATGGAVATTSYTYAKFGSYRFDATTIATRGSLKATGQKTFRLTALDTMNKPMANTSVFLLLSQAANGGTVTANGLAVTGTSQAFFTDDNGYVNLAYTMPDYLPAGGTDTVIASADIKGTVSKATTSYTHATLRNIVTPVNPLGANGSLHAGESAKTAFTAKDSYNKPMPFTKVYLSLNTVPVGSAVAGPTNTKLISTPQEFVTDQYGQVNVTYTAPAEMPNGATDTITIANSNTSRPTLSKPISYTYDRLAYNWDASTIATTGSLVAGQSKTFKLTVQNARGLQIGNAAVYLSLKGFLGNTAVTAGGTAYVNGDPITGALTDTPTKFVTDSKGQLSVTYVMPGIQPTGIVDKIQAQNKETLANIISATSYTFPTLSSLSPSLTSLASTGSLLPNLLAYVTFTATDSRRSPMPFTKVYLSLQSVTDGGTAYVVVKDSGVQHDVQLNGKPQEFVTNMMGQVYVKYKAPSILPKTGGTEYIKAQVNPASTSYSRSSYTYSVIR